MIRARASQSPHEYLSWDGADPITPRRDDATPVATPRPKESEKRLTIKNLEKGNGGGDGPDVEPSPTKSRSGYVAQQLLYYPLAVQQARPSAMLR